LQIVLEFQKYRLTSNMKLFNIFYDNENETVVQYVPLVKKMLDIQIGIQVGLYLERRFL